MNNNTLSFEDCVPGVRVVVVTGKHRGRHAVIHHPIRKMVAVTLNGERSNRNFYPQSLAYADHPRGEQQPDRPEQPRGQPPPPRRGFFRRTNANNADNDADNEDPDLDPTVPTPAGRRVHTRLQREMLDQVYRNDVAFAQCIDSVTQALVRMHFGSSAPVLEFIRDRIEATEAHALGNDAPEGEY